MKKTAKGLGAIALSATLALGCAAPAFAVGDEYGTAVGEQQEYVKKQNDTVATDVKVATVVTNINVAVPLDVTIVADAAGTDIMHPSSGMKHYDSSGNLLADGGITGYRIENYSTYPVAIKGIAAEDNSKGQWELVQAIAADNMTTGGANKIGDLCLTLTPAAQTKNTTLGLVNEGDVSGGNAQVALYDASQNAQTPGWIVDRKVTDTEPAIMGLLLEGKSSALKNVNDPSVLLGDKDNPVDPDPVMPDDAFKIIYTVGAASTAA